MSSKNFFKAILLSIVLIILEGSLFRRALGLSEISPQILILLTVFLAFKAPHAATALLVFTIGLMIDVSSGIRIGPWAGALIIVFGFLSTGAERLLVDSRFAVSFVCFLATLLSHIIAALLTFSSTVIIWNLILHTFFEALILALMAPIVFPLFNLFFSLSHNRNFSNTKSFQV
jgi:rod shape-determining protein MreD